MKKFLALTAMAIIPAVSFAQNDAEGIIQRFGGILDLLTPIVFSLALLFFFWGLADYILKSGEGKELGRSRMIGGLVALFVMFSVFGIIRFVQQSVGLDGSENEGINVPTLPSR